MAKVTNSRDGVKRMTLRVEHRIGFDDLVNNLCLAAVKGINMLDEDGDLPKAMSRNAIIETVKDTLASCGDDAANWWRDDAIDEDALEAWAKGIVGNAFPELAR